MTLNTIYNESCMDMLGRVESESIDLVVTDPPYRIIGGGCTTGAYGQPSGILQRDPTKIGGIMTDALKDTRAGKLFKYNDIEFAEWLPDVYRVLKQGTHAYIMVNARNLKSLQTEAEKVGFEFQQLLIWDKGNCTPKRYYLNAFECILLLRKGTARNVNDMGISNLLRVPNEVGKKSHPTQKPISLMQIFIEQSSNKGDVVLDPFMGAGSTALAAMRAGRNFVGTEIDKQYYDIALKRIEFERKHRQQTLF